MRKLQVSAGDKVFQFELEQYNGYLYINENGSRKIVDIKRLSLNRYSVIIDGRSIEVGVRRSEEGYQIFKNARSSNFVVEDYEVARIKKVAGIKDGKASKVVPAPMPGLIVSIGCNVGDEVRRNDGLLVMEAMKMENDIKAPVSGKIKNIFVEAGQSVDKGQKLVEFE